MTPSNRQAFRSQLRILRGFQQGTSLRADKIQATEMVDMPMSDKNVGEITG
jgi:hypothetical protein